MSLFNIQPNISKYNLVNKNNQVSPNYDLKNKEVYYELYLSPEKEICIVGKLDNNYIVWCSLTKLSDKEINAKIFNYIANSNYNIFSQEYKVLGKKQFEKIRKWYKCMIRKSLIPERYWETPFGHGYGNDKENHGKYFSRDIQVFFNEQLTKCDFRISEDCYLDILKSYFDILTADTDYCYYFKMKPLISILECESYLRLCQDVNIRALYLKCMEECSALYNRYMTVAR